MPISDPSCPGSGCGLFLGCSGKLSEVCEIFSREASSFSGWHKGFSLFLPWHRMPGDIFIL